MILPLMPLMQAQGISIDFREFISIISRYANLPEFNDILNAVKPQVAPGPETSGLPEPGSANVKVKEEIRTNRPGATRFGKDYALMQSLLGSRTQPMETGAITRGVR